MRRYMYTYMYICVLYVYLIGYCTMYPYAILCVQSCVDLCTDRMGLLYNQCSQDRCVAYDFTRRIVQIYLYRLFKLLVCVLFMHLYLVIHQHVLDRKLNRHGCIASMIVTSVRWRLTAADDPLYGIVAPQEASCWYAALSSDAIVLLYVCPQTAADADLQSLKASEGCVVPSLFRNIHVYPVSQSTDKRPSRLMPYYLIYRGRCGRPHECCT